MMVLYVYSLVFLCRSPRGTDKLKELSRQPVVVERVEQLLADSDPRVRQVFSHSYFFQQRPRVIVFFVVIVVLSLSLRPFYFFLFPIFPSECHICLSFVERP